MGQWRFGNVIVNSNFDSANLARVEKVYNYINSSNNLATSPNNRAGRRSPSPVSGGKSPNNRQRVDKPDMELNCWTNKDAHGTGFQSVYRSWFYFAVSNVPKGSHIKFNIMNMNRQMTLFSMGHRPVFRVIPQKPDWQRVQHKPTYLNVGAVDFKVSFCHTFEENSGRTEFAFCFPFSYTEYQNYLQNIDKNFDYCLHDDPMKTRQSQPDKIYYMREHVTDSLDGNRLDLLTISSYDGISNEMEHFIPSLFPNSKRRPYRFRHKRVFFISSRVHPGETPSSCVFNGMLKFLLRPNDLRAIALRKIFVFKLIPLLNPDGVQRGHFRVDQRGVNLNRVYLDPDPFVHSTIYAARKIMFYHHVFNSVVNSPPEVRKTVAHFGHSEPHLTRTVIRGFGVCPCLKNPDSICWRKDPDINVIDNLDFLRTIGTKQSGIAYYIDLHGHTSKKGTFFYANHITDKDLQVENLLYPKLISMNTPHFDYAGCNFTIRNMNSKLGAGRVAMYNLIGITHCYTLESNYYMGRIANQIASADVKGNQRRQLDVNSIGGKSGTDFKFPGPVYGLEHYESVGRGTLIAALDMLGVNPCCRIRNSAFTSLFNVRKWVVEMMRNCPSRSQSPNSEYTMSRKVQEYPAISREGGGSRPGTPMKGRRRLMKRKMNSRLAVVDSSARNCVTP